MSHLQKRKLNESIECDVSKKQPISFIPQVIYYPTFYNEADKREKARKISHSAIEKRRREKMNDKINQIKRLIPSCAEQENLHKMTILQNAIDYISYLKQIVSHHEQGSILIRGDGQLHIKSTKSMLPKEVEPFTHQFSIKQKSVDLTPLTPPQEPSSNMSLHHLLC